jgi:hypothetical protein
MLINACTRKSNRIYINCLKIKINNLFLFSKFIIFVNVKANDVFNFKMIFLKHNIFSLIFKEKEIKDLFDFVSFSFLRGGQYLIGFINDIDIFLSVVKFFENKSFYFSYKKCLNNVIGFLDVLDYFNKYNNNYIYIQFFLEKKKIKVIILLFFFLISFTQYIK